MCKYTKYKLILFVVIYKLLINFDFIMFNVNFEAMERDIRDILTGFEQEMLNKAEATEQLLNLHIISNPLPTKDEVIAEGNKQIDDWLSENSEYDQRVYRVAFKRSYEYVLRFIK